MANDPGENAEPKIYPLTPLLKNVSLEGGLIKKASSWVATGEVGDK